MNKYAYRTYAEINLNKLEHNLKKVRQLVGNKCKIMFVLKADAYGHGIPMCAKYSEPLVDWYAVATMDEALSIRRAGVCKPILLLGMLQDGEFLLAAKNNITINTCTLEYARYVNQALAKHSLTIECHVKIDTGMNRTGIFARLGQNENAVKEVEEIYSMSNLQVTGIYTHFSCADSRMPEDVDFTRHQYFAFLSVVEILKEKGYQVGLRHCVSTCSLLLHPEWKMDMVRVGMLGYGQSISAEYTKSMDLHPIIRWSAKVISVLDLDEGESISYGRIYRTRGREKIAVLSVGYADGYNRSYSNRATIILGGQVVPQCGKVCMDFTMANITGLEGIKVGDDAVLMGECAFGLVTPDSLSSVTEYGVNGWTTCQISSRVPRIYVYNGGIVGIRTLFH